MIEAIDFPQFIENWAADRERPTGADFGLPLPLAELTIRELVLRLRHVLGPVDLFWGLLLAHQFFVLADAWEQRQPRTSLDVYRTVLQLSVTSPPMVLERALELLPGSAQVLDTAVLATVWRKAIALHLPEEKRELAAPIAQVLSDILREPQALLAH